MTSTLASNPFLLANAREREKEKEKEKLQGGNNSNPPSNLRTIRKEGERETKHRAEGEDDNQGEGAPMAYLKPSPSQSSPGAPSPSNLLTPTSTASTSVALSDSALASIHQILEHHSALSDIIKTCQTVLKSAPAKKSDKLSLLTVSPSHSNAAVDKTFAFVRSYEEIIKEYAEKLHSLSKDVLADSSVIDQLGQHLNVADQRIESLLTPSIKSILLNLPISQKENSPVTSPPNLTHLRSAISTSNEHIDGLRRYQELKLFKQRFDEAKAANNQDQMSSLIKEGEGSYHLQWSELKKSPTLDRPQSTQGKAASSSGTAAGRELEQDVNSALKELIPSRLKQMLALLKGYERDKKKSSEFDSAFSSPSITLRSLMNQIEMSLNQLQTESHAEEVLKKAISKGDLEAIKLAVSQAEQAIKQREENLTPGDEEGAESFPSYPPTRKRMQLDELLKTAFLETARLDKIRSSSLALKAISAELDDERRISSVLQEAIAVGVPKEETEPVQRRLKEVETRLALQRAMDAKDIEMIQQAIQTAEKRLAKNEMEVRHTFNARMESRSEPAVEID